VKRTLAAGQGLLSVALAKASNRHGAITALARISSLFRHDGRIKRPSGTIPADAFSYLTNNNERLRDLRLRYQGHPACNHSQWSPASVMRGIDMRYFRADNMYLYQSRRYSPLSFYATSAFTKQVDRRGLIDLLVEDDYFGAEVFDFHGKAVSRDLLDSVLESNILSRFLPLDARPITILDIGSGYGRLAHRMTMAFAKLQYYCVDAIPESTFISEYYLKFRRADRCTCVPLDEITKTPLRGIDLAVNIHSFPECQSSAIAWWLDQLKLMAVPWLFVGVAKSLGLTSRERDGRRQDFLGRIEQAGYRTKAIVSKFEGAPVLQKEGLYPTDYYLFRQSLL
jgi:putative sugar O-methyltransferase